MAPTLSLGSTPSTTSTMDAFPPPPTHDTSLQQMPDVFVIPPEEEQDYNPPWCYFDAQEAKQGLSTSPDMDAVDVALNFFQQTDNHSPLFQRSFENESAETVIMPTRKSLGKDRSRTSNDELGIRSTGRGRDLDEEIVEVVKVRRNEGISDIGEAKNQSMKRTKTFRARASQALKSIKNVGRGSRKSSMSETTKPPQSGLENNEGRVNSETLPRPSTPNIARRKSMQLSQLFSSTRSNRFQMNIPDQPPSPTRDSPPYSPHHSSFPPRPQSSLASLGDRTNTPLGNHDDDVQPTLSSNKSFRRRISVLDIQRLFTPSSSSTSPLPSPAKSTFSRNSKRESVPISRLPPADSESMEDVFAAYSPTNPRPHSFHASQNLNRFSLATMSSSNSGPTFSLGITSPTSTSEIEDIIPETSFEMRLDSLQFDSLHFDPDEF
ncbi:hypothetical protein C8Q75DRAFT_801671 [Abortiporus biennis]|nr:hypothetical protein C8Q75DRAFT_801671 [Abortiporus biennis]